MKTLYPIHDRQVDEFTWAYITAAFWTTDEEEFPEYCYSGEFSISQADAERLAPGALTLIITVCEEFQRLYAEELETSGLTPDQAGHDFLLTRNRTGVSFRDRDIPNADALVSATRNYGEVSLIKGDDGLIYQM